MTEIEIRHAAFSYDGKTDIFTDLSHTIRDNEIFCVLGPNGIGKSTLLKAIMGLYRLREGEIAIGGRDVTRYPPEELARLIAYIPQTYQLAFPYKVLDMVLMGRTPHLNRMSRPSAEDYEKCGAAIQALDLEALVDRPCTQLSGGQMQLVMLARAMAQEARFILLDEPTSHLDFGKQLRTLDVIREMKGRGVGVVMTSHYPDQTFLVCDKVAIMENGGFCAVGTPDEVVTRENLTRAYGVDIRILPYTDENGVRRKTCVPGSPDAAAAAARP